MGRVQTSRIDENAVYEVKSFVAEMRGAALGARPGLASARAGKNADAAPGANT
jgi:hypothetical protein